MSKCEGCPFSGKCDSGSCGSNQSTTQLITSTPNTSVSTQTGKTLDINKLPLPTYNTLPKEEFNKIFNQNLAQEEYTYDSAIHSNPTSTLLAVTSNCDLKCPYCFVHQNPSNMSYETAVKGIEWIKKNYISSGQDGRPFVSFFGGEPLLRFNEIIVPIVEKYSSEIDFGLTTNGTHLTKPVVDFLAKYEITPLLSFDGVREVQDKQRPGKGFSSFDKLIENIPYALLKMPALPFRATITKDSIPFLFKSYKMAKELGFKTIFFGPNSFETWGPEEERVLKRQLNLIGKDVYLDLIYDRQPPSVSPLIGGVERLQHNFFTQPVVDNSIMRCGLGTTSCCITPQGDIIPCQEKSADPTWIIGNVKDGIIPEKHKAFLDWYWKNIHTTWSDATNHPLEVLSAAAIVCPSRLEDLDFKISSVDIIYYRVLNEVCQRLYELCMDNMNPVLRQYFNKEGVLFTC